MGGRPSPNRNGVAGALFVVDLPVDVPSPPVWSAASRVLSSNTGRRRFSTSVPPGVPLGSARSEDQFNNTLARISHYRPSTAHTTATYRLYTIHTNGHNWPAYRQSLNTVAVSACCLTKSDFTPGRALL